MQNQSDYGQQPQMKKTLSCSFCGKGQDEVEKLIAGPSVYICNECISLCNEIIAGKESHHPQRSVEQKTLEDQ